MSFKMYVLSVPPINLLILLRICRPLLLLLLLYYVRSTNSKLKWDLIAIYSKQNITKNETMIFHFCYDKIRMCVHTHYTLALCYYLHLLLVLIIFSDSSCLHNNNQRNIQFNSTARYAQCSHIISMLFFFFCVFLYTILLNMFFSQI